MRHATVWTTAAAAAAESLVCLVLASGPNQGCWAFTGTFHQARTTSHHDLVPVGGVLVPSSWSSLRGSSYLRCPTVRRRHCVSVKEHVVPSTPQEPLSNNDFDRTAASVVPATAAAAEPPPLDRVLSRLTSAFPLFVLGTALVAVSKPSLLSWVNAGSWITIMLATVMCGTGLTLERSDFTNVLMGENWTSVPLGVVCQYMIMPCAAWLLGRTLLLHHSSGSGGGSAASSSLFLGLCLVGCAPGGTASNLVTLIAGADVALSVILTACSTVLAVVMTPLLVKLLLVGATATTSSSSSAHINVSGWALCQATARVVLGPVLLGMYLKARMPQLARTASRFAPFASVIMVSLICGGVVAQNAPLLLSLTKSSSSSSSLVSTLSSGMAAGGGASIGLFTIVLSVVLLHVIGFAAGYIIPRALFGRNITTSRTISIEVGMQNSALAVVLARSMGADPLASLPGALSATVHSCLGSLLAAIWRIQNNESPTKLSQPKKPTISSSAEDYVI